MKVTSPSELKTILHSKRANLYYLEHCRVLCNGGRVEYVTDEGSRSLYWNIPIANTTAILLGSGTSITQAAMRELAKAGVMVGFCGGGGTPLFAGTEREIDLVYLQPQSEYRPTNYLQAWVRIFEDDARRLSAAKKFQNIRLDNIEKHWLRTDFGGDVEIRINEASLRESLTSAREDYERAATQTDLLAREALLAKTLYRYISQGSAYGDFTRAPRGTGADAANRFLDQGNYLAYGLGATAAWVLGLPHGLAVLHGKTRRGGLVFDIADLIKDAIVLPTAFIGAMLGEASPQFRARCIAAFQEHEVLDTMIESVKAVIEEV